MKRGEVTRVGAAVCFPYAAIPSRTTQCLSKPHLASIATRTDRPTNLIHFGQINCILPFIQRQIDRFALSYVYEPTTQMQKIQSPELERKIQTVRFPTTDNLWLHGWYIPPKQGKETILYAHGNAGNISTGFRQANMESFVREGFGFLAFDYRGYGLNEGKPSEKGVYDDYRAALEYLKKVHKLTPQKDVVAVGESLGGAVVVDAATEIPFRAVMLFSTFTTMFEMMERRKRGMGIPDFIKVSPTVQKMFPSIDKIAKIRSPLLIAHGDHDSDMPLSMAQRMHERATGSLYKVPLYVVKGGEHNDLFIKSGPALSGKLTQLLQTTQNLQIPAYPS